MSEPKLSEDKGQNNSYIEGLCSKRNSKEEQGGAWVDTVAGRK